MKPNWAAVLMFLFLSAFFGAGAVGSEYGLYLGWGGSVEVPSFKMPTGTQQFTVEVRFKELVSASQSASLVSAWNDDAQTRDRGFFRLDLAPPNRIACSLRNDKGQVETVSGDGTGEAYAWHHAAAVWDGSQLSVFWDGKAIGSRKAAGFKVPTDSALPLVIGAAARAGQKTAAFRGFVGEVAVWSKVRTAEEIAQDAAKPIAGYPQSLPVHLIFRQAAPTDVVRDKQSSAEGRLSPGLARVGWCQTPMWDQPEPERPYLHLFSYDLSSPPKSGATDSKAAILKHPARQILVQNAKSQQLGVLWQDRASNGVYVTWVDAGLRGHETTRLKGMEDGTLAAGTADPAGHLYYLEILKDRNPAGALQAKMFAAAPDGKALRERPVDTAAAGGLNVFGFGGRWFGSMAFQGGLLGLILPRTYDNGHQAANAVIFSAQGLAMAKNLGQITSHSFGNLVTVNSRGEFLGIDLGDNYPRGIQIHKFTAAGRTSRLLFTYKVAHGSDPRRENFPVYKAISGGGKTFYQWSNDNNTYTELGGAVEGQMSYSVIFATDRSPEGRVLDNSRTFPGCDDPRDLALLRVVKDFQKVPTGIEGGDAILAGVPKGSRTETSGFFDFGGKWCAQRVAGVIWLTEHKKGEAVHAPQPVRLHDGSVLILWEKTGPGGPAVCATKIAESGKILGEAICPGLDLHFSREDHIVTMGGCIFLLATDKSTGTTRLCFIEESNLGDTLFREPSSRKAHRGQ